MVAPQSEDERAYQDMLRYAREQWDIWKQRGLRVDQIAEQIDAHLESEFPEVPEIMTLDVLTEVFDEHF